MIEDDQALAGRLEPEEHLGESRLAAAQLADDRQNLRLPGGEGDVLDRLDRAALPLAEQGARGDPVVLLQPLDVEDRAPMLTGSSRAAGRLSAAQSIASILRHRL